VKWIIVCAAQPVRSAILLAVTKYFGITAIDQQMFNRVTPPFFRAMIDLCQDCSAYLSVLDALPQ
jgi:hypothetical protein